MAKPKSPSLDAHYHGNVVPELKTAPWTLRVTEQSDKPVPVLVVKQRILPEEREDTDNLVAPRSILKERGLIYGPPLLRCLPVLRTIVGRVRDEAGIPLELHRYLQGQRITFRGNLPLDDEAGRKIALIAKLRERIGEMDRVELLARRVDTFSREESGYWFSRITHYGDAANRWALAGMKTMLAGHPKDKDIEPMLERLRNQ